MNLEKEVARLRKALSDIVSCKPIYPEAPELFDYACAEAGAFFDVQQIAAKALKGEQRTAKRYIGRQLYPIDFAALQKGDMFSLYEPDGELVKSDRGHTIFCADSDAFLNGYGVYEIEVLFPINSTLTEWSGE